jgi:hypothetical protein
MRKAVHLRPLSYSLSLVAAGIIALLPFHAFFTTWLGSNTGHLDLVRIWKEILIVCMIPGISILITQSPDLKKWFFRSKLLWLMRAYALLSLLLGLIALSTHKVTASALIYGLIINLRFLIFFIVCYVLASSSDFLKNRWPKLLLIPATLVIGFGLLQLVLPYDFLRHFGYGPHTIPAYQTVDSNLGFQRIQSFLRGANPLGAYLVIIIPAIILLLKGWRRYVLLAGSLIVMAYSYSRSAWLGLLAVLALLGLLKIKGHPRLKEGLIAATLAVVLIGFGVYALRTNQTAQDALFHTSSSSSNVSSNNQRAKAIKQGFSDAVHQPLGSGTGTAGPASVRNSSHPARIVENYYLQIAQEVGWLGLALFLAINYLVAARLWGSRDNPLALLLFVSFIGISLINLVSHAWADDTLSMIWWGLAGLAMAPAARSTHAV